MPNSFAGMRVQRRCCERPNAIAARVPVRVSALGPDESNRYPRRCPTDRLIVMVASEFLGLDIDDMYVLPTLTPRAYVGGSTAE